jgi:hypothetical protein
MKLLQSSKITRRTSFDDLPEFLTVDECAAFLGIRSWHCLFAREQW